MRKWAPLAVNIVLYQTLWTLTVMSATGARWWLGPTLIVASMLCQAGQSPAPGKEALVIILGAAVGCALDGLSMQLGFLRFHGGGTGRFALVFYGLWVNFGTTLRPGFSWMWKRPVLAAVLGAIGGPLAYSIGRSVGAIDFPQPSWRGLVWAATQFAIVLPIWMAIAARTIQGQVGTGPQTSGRDGTR